MATKTHSHSKALARWSPPRAIKPVVVKVTKIQKPKHKHKRHHGGGGMLGGLTNRNRMGIVIGAFAVGVLEKQNIMSQLPALPFLGRTGTIGVAAYLLSNGGKNKLADEVCTAAFVLATHELASTGTIVGADGGAPNPQEVGYVAGW